MATKPHFGMGSKNLKKCALRTRKMKKIYYDPNQGYPGVDNLKGKTRVF